MIIMIYMEDRLHRRGNLATIIRIYENNNYCDFVARMLYF